MDNASNARIRLQKILPKGKKIDCQEMFLYIFGTILLSFISFTSCTTYYVSPEGNNVNCTFYYPCSIQQGFKSVSENGDVIVLFPGIYSVNETIALSYSNIHIQSYSETEFNAIITSHNVSTIFLLQATNSTLKYLSFINITNINTVISSLDVTIINCNFENINTNTPSWIIYNTQDGSIINTTFKNCSNAGIIYVGNKGNIVNSSFVDCSAFANYSVPPYNTHSNLIINFGLILIQNSVINNTMIKNCKTEIASLTPITNFGAIIAARININNSTIDNCSAYSVSPNKLKTFGRVVNIAEDALIFNSTFISSNSLSGGSVIFQNGIVQYCKFINSYSDVEGGAISVLLNGSIINSAFTNCSSEIFGGAVYFNSSGQIENVIFNNCSALSGGGVYFGKFGSISNSNFYGCDPINGGAYAISSNDAFNNRSISLENNKILWNVHPILHTLPILKSQNDLLYATNDSLPSSNCTAEFPCDLATAISLSNNGTVIILLDGDYYISSQITIFLKNLTFVGSNRKVKIYSNGPVFNMKSSAVIFSDIQFGPLESSALENVLFFDEFSPSSIVNCYFTNIQSQIPIISSQSYLIISNNTFENCTSRCSSTRCDGSVLRLSDGEIENSRFYSNGIIETQPKSECYGGAISLYNHNITIENSVFKGNFINCSESYGAAISIDGESFSYLQVIDSIFESNQIPISSHSGNCTIGYGGAIFIQIDNPQEYQISFSDSLFEKNSIYSAGFICENGTAFGGAISIRLNTFLSPSTLTSSFLLINNTKMDANAIIMPISTFIGGNAIGGALSFDASLPVFILNSTFTNNSITGGTTSVGLYQRISGSAIGGAITIFSSSAVTIDNCSFESNSANGGIILSANPYAAGGNAFGGAITLFSNVNIISNCFFINNTVKPGNGTIQNTINPYYGLGQGGGIWMTNGEISSVYSINNGCEGDAWGVCDGAFAYISGNLTASNVFSEGDWMNGYITSGSLKVNDSLDLHNSSFNNIQIKSISNDVRSMSNGGAINSLRLSIHNTNITNTYVENQYQIQGIAVYCESLEMQNCKIDNNEGLSSNCSGTLWINYGIIKNSTMNNNVCIPSNTNFQYGGSLFSYSDNLLLEDVLMNNNTATYGGAICIGNVINNSSLTFNNVLLSNNFANQNGGGIFLVNSTVTLQCEGLFTPKNNSAAIGGNDCGSSIASFIFYPEAIITSAYPGLVFSTSLSLLNYFGSSAISPSYYATVDSTSLLSTGSQGDIAYQSHDGLFHFNKLQLFSNDSVAEIQFTAQSQLFPTEYQISVYIRIGKCGPNTISSDTINDLPECVLCDPNEFNFGNNENCTECPSTSNLPSSCFLMDQDNSLNFQIEGGYWPNDFVNPSDLYPCHFDAGCYPINCTSTLENSNEWDVNCNYCGNDLFSSPDECDLLCKEGYTGRLCSQCVCTSFINCRYESGNACVMCYEVSDNETLVFRTLVIILIALVAFLIFGIIALIIPKTTLFWIVLGFLIFVGLALLDIITWYYAGFLVVLLLLYFIADKQIPGGVLKCLFFYLQIITSIMDIRSWPVILQGLVSTFAITNMDISFLACFWPSELSNPLTLYILFNLIVPVLAILACITVYTELIFKRSKKIANIRKAYDNLVISVTDKVSDHIPDNISHFLDEFTLDDAGLQSSITDSDSERESESDSDFDSENERESSTPLLIPTAAEISKPKKKKTIAESLPKMYRIFFILIGASYFPVAIMTFSVLQCTNGYMAIYQWIPCDSSSSYYSFLTIGILILLFFIFAYPMLLLFILFKIRKKVQNMTDENNASHQEYKKYEFILDGYRSKIFFFEICYILEKLSIAIALTVLPRNSISQFLLIDATIIFGMFVQYSLRPYELKSLNYVVFFSQCVIGLSYFYNILSEMYRNILDFVVYLSVLSWVCAILNGIVLISYLLLTIEPKLKSFIRRRRARKKKVPLVQFDL